MAVRFIPSLIYVIHYLWLLAQIIAVGILGTLAIFMLGLAGALQGGKDSFRHEEQLRLELS